MSKGYPRTQFEIINQTGLQEIAQNTVGNTAPMAMAVYTSDKGPEEWRVIYGLDNFVEQVGSISFIKHGQAQLTVAEELRAGGAVLCKRMLPFDATLANVTIHARVVQSNNISYVYYYAISGTDIKTFDEACTTGYEAKDIVTAENALNVDYFDVPLFTVTTMGRGASNMFFSITPKYASSRASSYIIYTFEVYENGSLIESISFSMNPDIVANGVAQGINPKLSTSKQVKVCAYEDNLYKFISVLAQTAVDDDGNPIPIGRLANYDFINGCYNNGKKLINGIVTDTGIKTKTVTNEESGEQEVQDVWATSIPEFKKFKLDEDGNVLTTGMTETVDDMIYYHLNGSADTGMIPLTNGSYGSLTNTPMNQPEVYELMLRATFGDTSLDDAKYLFDPVIYDVDMYKLDFICDCNFPISAKKAIMALVDVRGDMVFLADLGTSVKDIEGIREIVEEQIDVYSTYTALYHNWCKIYDPYSHKQITVTIPFLLAPKMVEHIAGGPIRPFCGILHNITFPDIVYGSLNFVPINLPNDIDQKEALANMNVNYISYYDGLAVMDTEYVNYQGYDQFSYLNNIMGVQEVIKAVRTHCPKVRYTFINGSDFEKYLDDANAVINRFTSNFDFIEMKYMNDKNYEANKIFYATITVRFKNFVNEEYFRVIAVATI